MCSIDITEPDGTKIHLLSPYKQHNVQSYYYEIVWTSDFDNTASIVFNITLAEVIKLRFLEKICAYCNCIKRFWAEVLSFTNINAWPCLWGGEIEETDDNKIYDKPKEERLKIHSKHPYVKT